MPNVVGRSVILLLATVFPVAAADFDAATTQFKHGEYEQCVEAAQKTTEEGATSADWAMLWVRSLMALGRYDEAAERADDFAQNRYPLHLPFLKCAYAAYLYNGQVEQAERLLQRIYRFVRMRWFESLNNPELIAAGQSLLLLGAEPRGILDEFYNRALRNDPNDRDAYLAAGELALAKQDYALAANQFRKGLERFADDPDCHHGLARAYYHSDRLAMMFSLDAALVVNPRHVPALLLLAEHHIEAESRPGALDLLKRVEKINPWHPQAWALRAVIAHLDNDVNEVSRCRSNALKFWPSNPEVDHIIGRKLSRHYRFAEGAAFQKQALELNPRYLAAQGQLAEDLLRLGDETQGWQLAEMVHKADPYSVTAYNLVNLRDKLNQYETVTADGLVIRMDPQEVAVYGERVRRLLSRAKATLCQKYDLTLEKPVTVELYVDQQDFAVRTFGVPGGDGFLGVCFGNLITANSPKLERSANWEATLWHEFCHVVTLNMTQNKMPRWLSEGISVYEELQQDSRWGQRMTPEYRQLILDGGLTPISELSSAFLSPPTPQHLQFAYYESALVVAFLVDRFGLDSLKTILRHLGTGGDVNDLISRYTLPMEDLEQQFEAFVQQRVRDMAPKINWDRPVPDQVSPQDPEAVKAWLEQHPHSYWGLSLYAHQLIKEKRWDLAKQPLKKLIDLYPENTSEGNAYIKLAQVHRQLNETQAEYRVLQNLAEHSADDSDAYLRLMEIAAEQGDWEAVLEYGEAFLAVYPLLGQVYADLGYAHEALHQNEPAAHAYNCLLHLDPENPADVHYRLARLLHDRDPDVAKRHLLESLADAPRFRAAQKLLLKMSDPAALRETSPKVDPVMEEESL
ncbi:peptidase MA family metallohydrolase [Planctomycetota bacterium]